LVGGLVTTIAESPQFGWDSLSKAERRVADLVAQGYTNREAAVKLFLSRYTIDSHLRHIFAKLGIGSRAELARITAERNPSSSQVGSGLLKPTVPTR
jgi:DNA-binding CsgD family transcriptional regulator